MEIDQKEVLRYLGCNQAFQEQRILDTIKECITELTEKARKKYIYKYFPCVVENAQISIGPMNVHSAQLAKNLEGCHEVAVFAATLGTIPDFLQKQYGCLYMSKAVVMQAVSAAGIEAFCDLCQQEIQKEMKEQGCFLRPRFSPGYGDFSLKHQHDIIRLLDTPRKIGLTVTDSCMLVPSKSVTAVIGISKEPIFCQPKGCEACEKTDCLFRRE